MLIRYFQQNPESKTKYMDDDQVSLWLDNKSKLEDINRDLNRFALITGEKQNNSYGSNKDKVINPVSITVGNNENSQASAYKTTDIDDQVSQLEKEQQVLSRYFYLNPEKITPYFNDDQMGEWLNNEQRLKQIKKILPGLKDKYGGIEHGSAALKKEQEALEKQIEGIRTNLNPAIQDEEIEAMTNRLEQLKGIQEKKDAAKKALNDVLDRQYNSVKTVEIRDLADAPWKFNNYLADYYMLQNSLGNIADDRMDKAFKLIDQNGQNIRDISKEYGVPEEILASIILKEQYTKSISDPTANTTAAIGYEIPLLREYPLSIVFGDHTTGLGAVFSTTARPAWEAYLGKENADRFLPGHNLELQKKLASDPVFNIQSMAVVLGYKAIQLGLIKSFKEVNKLRADEWEKVLEAYNGSGSKAKKYSKFVYEYLPYMKEYLGT